MSSVQDPSRVVIVGGGFAGVAAACRLAADGFQPLLLERALRLGGRAASFVDRASGEEIDYGHHVSMRCCTATDGFLRRIGASDSLVYQERLDVPIRCGESSAAVCSTGWLPGILHLAPSLSSYPLLTVRERLQAARAGLALLAMRRRSKDQSFGSWLDASGQTARTIGRLWDPIIVATLNAHIDDVSVLPARHVLRDGFFDPEGAGLGHFVRPLGEIFRSAASYIEAHGGEVRLSAPVKTIRAGAGGGFSIELRSGGTAPETLDAAAVITAVPPSDLSRMIDDPQLDKTLVQALELRWEPIVDVHLWFGRQVLDTSAFFVAVESDVQAVFDLPRERGRGGSHLVISLSAASDWIDQESEAIVARLTEDLVRLLPSARGARLERQLVLKHCRATFLPAPGADALRPGAKTSLEGLYLAGDWTATGWPSTVEGAIRSGVAAAGRLETEWHPPENNAGNMGA